MHRRHATSAAVTLALAGALIAAGCGGGGTSAPSSTVGTTSTAAVTSTQPATSAAPTSTAPPSTTAAPTTAAPTTTTFSLKSLPGKIAFVSLGCGQAMTNEDLESLRDVRSVEEARDALAGFKQMTMQVCVMNPDGSDLMLVSDPKGEAYDPVWSRDGSVLFFSDGSRTLVVNADGTNRHFRKKNELPALGESPDGKWLVYRVWGDSRFFIQESKPSGVAVKKPATPRDACCETGRWSPDSKYLLYTSAEGSGDDCHQLWKANIETGEATKITGLGTPSESQDLCVVLGTGQWSPDGTAIVFERDVDVDGETLARPFLVAPDGTDVRPLLAEEAFGERGWVYSDIAWSPDGRALVIDVATMTGAGNGAYIVTVDGQTVIKIDDPGNSLLAVARFAWAPGF